MNENTKTMTRKIYRLTLALVLALIGLTAQASAQTSNLNGSWQLNREQSDDARKKLQEAISSAGGARRSDRGGRRGGGILRGRGGNGDDGRASRGGGMNDEQRERASEMRQEMMEAAETLTINYQGTTFTITDGNNRVRTFRTDGSKQTQQGARGGSGSSGGEIETRARVQSENIVIERKPERGGKLIETYALSPDNRQLYVTLQIENKRLGQPITIRRVYDAAANTSQIPTRAETFGRN